MHLLCVGGGGIYQRCLPEVSRAPHHLQGFQILAQLLGIYVPQANILAYLGLSFFIYKTGLLIIPSS